MDEGNVHVILMCQCLQYDLADPPVAILDMSWAIKSSACDTELDLSLLQSVFDFNEYAMGFVSGFFFYLLKNGSTWFKFLLPARNPT